ncbi:MAG: hypothetical protein LBI53_04930 [Candidatus Peribacteria bacterium]|jgi:hypothetical protein|nr:hypothetical protein [Candidatus Peribacteria bacterium]
MKDFYQQIMEEHPDVDKKDLSRFLKSFTSPDIEINSDFSSSLKRKLFHIIRQEDENNYLEQLKLIPFKVKFRYHLGGFAVAMFAFLFVFVVVFFTDFFSNQLLVPSKYVEVESIKIEKGEGVKGADEDGVAIRTMFADAVLLMNNTQEEESYLYDGKKYPKVATEMPIYRHS